MARTAKLFRNGGSLAVRLPAEFRFEGKEVFIRRDPVTGDVILSPRPESWKNFSNWLIKPLFPPIFSWNAETLRRKSASFFDAGTISAGHQHRQLCH
jgi:antitoxin VapB